MINATILNQPVNEAGKYDITLGVLIGIGVTFGGYWLADYLKNKRFKKNIRRLVRIEFAYYRTFFEDVIKQGMVHPTKSDTVCIEFGSELAKKLIQLSSAQYESYFDPKNYPKLKVETKAIAFDKNLIDVENTYYAIRNIRYYGLPEIEGKYYYAFNKPDMETLIQKIKKTEDKI